MYKNDLKGFQVDVLGNRKDLDVQETTHKLGLAINFNIGIGLLKKVLYEHLGRSKLVDVLMCKEKKADISQYLFQGQSKV